MNNNLSSLSLSLSLSLGNSYKRGGQAGLNLACSPRLPKGGLRQSDNSQMLIDYTGGDSCG